MKNFSTTFLKQTLLILIFVGFIISNGFCQANKLPERNTNQAGLNSTYLLSSLQDGNYSGPEIEESLAFKTKTKKWGKVNLPPSLANDDFVPWESKKHFWFGAMEIAILEFIPWAMAKWIRNWEDPADNWANVSKETWWRNISMGWEYDGDNFQTNNFAHPYHGALFFNAGRTNGYDFWESTAWALTGSAIWEYFGETFRPSINDWIYTGIGGSNLGEILYRLSSMVTDNRATGSERVWSEIFGTLLNPVRGFNRLVTGEMNQNFDNPKWSRPKDFVLALDAGIRSVDLNGIKDLRNKQVHGLFDLELAYGLPITAKKPFDFFAIQLGVASEAPHFTQLNTTGFLFGKMLKPLQHYFGVTLDFTYNNIAPSTAAGESAGVDEEGFEGLLYGSAMIHPYLMSIFPIGSKTLFVSTVGINGVMMGATPNDYFIDPEGRNYDMGPGVGVRVMASIREGIWDYVRLLYFGNWIWTQTEPSDSKHRVQIFYLEGQYPLTSYFAFGVAAGVYWRTSIYQNHPDIDRNHPIIRIFFKTAILNL
jgi:hypothetical protein